MHKKDRGKLIGVLTVSWLVTFFVGIISMILFVPGELAKFGALVILCILVPFALIIFYLVEVNL